MSLDQELREVLAEQADRCQAPTPDIGALLAGGLLRRRRRRGVGAMAGLAILASLFAGLAVGLGVRDTGGVSGPVAPPTPGIVKLISVPGCVYDPAHDGKEFIVGAGVPIKTRCRYGGPAGHVYLWHQAGSTVLATGDGVYRVADGRLTQLGVHSGAVVRMSHDGRYAAWLSDAGGACGVLTLDVYEVATATEIATTQVPRQNCSHIQGIDDLGRVYVTVGEDEPGVSDVIWMYDMRANKWTQVVGIPTGTTGTEISYVTADGLAVQTEVSAVESLALASVEGVVDSGGRFVRQRAVPVGRGLWSPDRSLVVEQRPEGVVVRPAADLTAGVMLDLPVDRFRPPTRERPEGWLPANLHWLAASLVLVSTAPAQGEPYLCDVLSGACKVEPSYLCDVLFSPCTVENRTVDPALGNNAQPSG